MTAEGMLHPTEPLIAKPPATLTSLRAAVTAVAPARLPEFFEDMQKAFVQAGDDDSVLPIRMFYRRWAVVVEIERHPDQARRLHAAERALDSENATIRDRAIREAGDIVRAAHREVEVG